MATLDAFRLDGARALVTGASRGIGAAISLLFAEAGADIAVSARKPDFVEEVAEQARRRGGRAEAITADLSERGSSEELVSEAASRLGGLDILVHCAGMLPLDEDGRTVFAPLQDFDYGQWSPVLAVNLEASVELSRAAHPHLAESGRGNLILVSSIAGFSAAPAMEAYAVTKSAQISLVRSLAISWAPAGIRVNAMCPGWTATELTGAVRADPEGDAALMREVPMRRWGRPEEIATGTLFLASEASSFMTGQTLVIDGGLTTRSVMGPLV
ncbi:NAD(P)-dependent dehydrogenase (short-subunit alcohol dehydrogenase family) [Crossiella equi]|uniref:NAD(P)-dependent dehydrogenase (Short-subunit alcohol dehydrogenase family) n=1 Tax=Crossiella equi TaxID=130796 RepID=A0ABS5ASI8_9PSEU|nr:SDR family NAD(P)-dependent oxidoreductase [Crossiella equi]MBP2479549.1 NAD(P)-dependent dehydrogenase (short-subunit alcohol dehydrogenase family) [Crossiella equi]